MNKTFLEAIELFISIVLSVL